MKKTNLAYTSGGPFDDMPGYKDWDEYIDNLKRIQNEAEELQHLIKYDLTSALDEIGGLSDWNARWEKVQEVTDNPGPSTSYDEVGDMGVDLAVFFQGMLDEVNGSLEDLIKQCETNLKVMS